MIYKEKDGAYEGISVSNFTPETEFTLKEKVEDDKMYVSEVFRKNGKITSIYRNGQDFQNLTEIPF